ncbi:MAG: hypothetical protein K6F86_03270 [Lachnospiraceae bacterium]|nr:hypothetical protein [Lachnospiraceae bacterium]
MTEKDIIDACDILVKLEQEFSAEEGKLSEISNEHAVKIDELDQQISTFRRNEDVDFRVFSPRNISTGASDKIKALEEEKKQLEREKKDADKQLKYYSGKADMISRVLSILRGDLKNGSGENDPEFRRSRNPFAFLDEEPETENSEVDEQVDIVSELFKKPVDDEDAEGSVNKETKEISFENVSGVPVDEVERVCHKVEFCEKIISNDGIRAKLEIKNIVTDLRELIRAYGK